MTCRADIPDILVKCWECWLDMLSNSVVQTMPDDMTCHVRMTSANMSADFFLHKKQHSFAENCDLVQESHKNGIACVNSHICTIVFLKKQSLYLQEYWLHES